jgi:uncharacterized protein YbjT (DUF2867 family)
MVRILLTDAVGLIGAYTLNALLALPSLQSSNATASPHTILAGYHAPGELASVPVPAPPVPGAPTVEPVLVDWDDARTRRAALRGVDRVLLLTRLSATKAADVEAWMADIEAEVAARAAADARRGPAQQPALATERAGAAAEEEEGAPPRVHVVHVGIHTDASAPASARPAHETWMLAAESLVRDRAASDARITGAMLRINFDGYNGLLRPGAVAYFVPARERYGWMAREDIAEVAARVLVDPARWAGGTFALAAQGVSLEEMARDAEAVMGFPIQVKELESREFVEMAGRAPDYEGYGEYVRSVAGMFDGLRKGEYGWHKDVFVERFEEVVGRKPVTFREWLATSSMRKKLERGAS